MGIGPIRKLRNQELPGRLAMEQSSGLGLNPKRFRFMQESKEATDHETLDRDHRGDLLA